MYKFINNNIIILFFILYVFYYLCTYNNKIIENMDATGTNTSSLTTLNNLITEIRKPDKNNLSLQYDNVNIIGTMKCKTLKFGTITLKDENGILVIDKPIRSDKATIGDWSISENKINVDKNCNILMENKEVKFMDNVSNKYNTIIAKNIQTKKISAPLTSTGENNLLKINTDNITTQIILKNNTSYGGFTNNGMDILNDTVNKNARLKLNYGDILYKSIEPGSIIYRDEYGGNDTTRAFHNAGPTGGSY